MSEFTLRSIHQNVRYFTPDTKLVIDFGIFYEHNLSVATELGITKKMTTSDPLSKGEKTLFIILWAIISGGKGILLMDELLANLDRENYVNAMTVLRKYCTDCVVIIIDNSLSSNELDFTLPPNPDI